MSCKGPEVLKGKLVHDSVAHRRCTLSHFVSSCSGKDIKFVMDLDNTLVHSALDQYMTDKDRRGLASLLDAERSLLPEQRTLHCFHMAEHKMWVKLRPTARELLEKLAEVGQLAVFTLGTGYALPHQRTSSSTLVQLVAYLLV